MPNTTVQYNNTTPYKSIRLEDPYNSLNIFEEAPPLENLQNWPSWLSSILLPPVISAEWAVHWAFGP